MGDDDDDDDDNVSVVVSLLLLSLFASVRGRWYQAVFRHAVSSATTVMGWCDADGRRFYFCLMVDVDVVYRPICISVDRFLAQHRWELISVNLFWRDVGGSCSLSTVFGTTQVGVVITTDNDGVIRRPVCALVALLGALTASPAGFGATQVGVVITTDDDDVARRPVCAFVACWGP